jgi:archaellum component FlaD/FlaE
MVIHDEISSMLWCEIVEYYSSMGWMGDVLFQKLVAIRLGVMSHRIKQINLQITSCEKKKIYVN